MKILGVDAATPIMHRLAFGLMLLGLILQAVPSRAQETLLWLKTEWPPVFMATNTGFGDHATAWLIERLPGYSHEIRSLPLARLLKTLEQQDMAICASGLARTPAREAQFAVGRDFMRMPAPALVVRADHADAFAPFRQGDGRIEMHRLLQQGQLHGAINDSRSYGTVLDDLLRNVAKAGSVDRLAKTSNMVSMLTADRMDWLLLYPFEAIWQSRRESVAPALAALPISEIPATIGGGITCNRSPAGQRAIAAIDTLIAANPQQPWMQSMLDWLDPDTLHRMAR